MPLLLCFLIAYVLVEAVREVHSEARSRLAPGWQRVRDSVDGRLRGMATHPVGRYVATAARLGLGAARGLGNSLVFVSALAGAAVRGARRGVRRAGDWWADHQARREHGHGEVPGEVIDMEPATEPEPDPPRPTGIRECPRCRSALLVQPGQRICAACVARQQTRREDHDRQQADNQNGDTTMIDVPEASFEPTIAALDSITEELRILDATIEAVEASRDRLRQQVATLTELLTAQNIDTATLAGLSAAVDGLSPIHIDPLVQATEEAAVAVEATRQNVITTYADAHATVAETGINATFLQAA